MARSRGALAGALAGQVEVLRPKAGGFFDESGAGAHPTAPEAGALPGTDGADAPGWEWGFC
jgi:hypothetical protein